MEILKTKEFKYIEKHHKTVSHETWKMIEYEIVTDKLQSLQKLLNTPGMEDFAKSKRMPL